MTSHYKSKINRGWTVALAALGINLILGILYSWSLIQKALVSDWGWTNTEASLPYTICIITFSIVMIFAGRAQDTYGPRPVSFLGGILLGAGLIISTFAFNPVFMIITFGIIGGIGIGLGFSAGTPCAMKWFQPEKKGIIAGVVVSGVGLSPIYIAPVTDILLRAYGIQDTFLYLGLFALTGITLLSMMLRNPPPGYIPDPKFPASSNVSVKDFTWREMLQSRIFFLLWISFMMSATAGLMLIGHLANIASVQANWEAGFILVAILAIFNAVGRITGGFLSDTMGRTNALFIVFLIQAANMFLFAFYTTIPALLAGSIIAGLAYGALFALFPAATADFFGLSNLGVNYGLIFTGFGVAGIVGPVMGGMAADYTGTYNVSYVISAIMLLAGAVLVKSIKIKMPQN
jgi:MFS transporter, OFA family, oxalate/formate antiporter